MPRKKDPLQKQIDDLTAQLEPMRKAAMRRAGYKAFGVKEVASFHGTIGGKNNDYVDSIRQVFLSRGQFLAEWKEGALAKAAARDEYELKTYGRRYQNSAVHDILRMLKDPVIGPYIDLFLERNFYRQYHARIRAKPEDALWEIWLGSKNQEYGLFITPRFRNGAWENDVSEIRRVNFEYWTIGHVLHSGFLIAGKDQWYETATLDELFKVYQHVLVRSTGSIYSVAFGEKYEEYIRDHDRPESFPFLIPEFRYEGATGRHKYRLDFTILSASRNLKIGIELSPWSTHGRVKGKRKLRESGGETAIEKAQIKKWEADTQKRNAYFKKFGITTLTFTDSDLANMDEAFSQIEPYLSPPRTRKLALPQVRGAIAAYGFDVAKKLDLTH
jgi:hypothetical protein